MIFSTLTFILIYLPLVLLIHKTLPKKWINYFLLVASLFFYAYGEPKFVFVMIASITMNYLFGLLINRKRSPWLMGIAVALNLSLLVIFKYLNFATNIIDHIFLGLVPQTDIALPIGISFFTFQAMSYVIDVYRRNVQVQKNPFYMGLYISFFPQLIAGPIVRYETIEKQIYSREITVEGFSEGVRRFLIGFFKKILIANNMAIVAEKAFAAAAAGEISMSFAWLGALAFTMQIFFDFSGYSDMAIGLGRMFGFQFLENFNYPYLARSVTDFWRRWHISLSSWFRDYVYIPLGGSRVASKRILIRNMFIVWLLTGIWHGASFSFIVWGLFYFLLLSFEKLTGYPEKFKSKAAKGVYRGFTLLCVMLNWIVFYDAGPKTTMIFIGAMFGGSGMEIWDLNGRMYLGEYWVFFLFAIVYSIGVFQKVKEKMGKSRQGEHICASAAMIVYPALLIIALSYLVMGMYNPFIYFNF